MTISVMFEILEYTLEHQLPNFSECWWDHVSTHGGCVVTVIVYDYNIMFEILEYTLEHQLPNLNECCWDHISTHGGCLATAVVYDYQYNV